MSRRSSTYHQPVLGRLGICLACAAALAMVIWHGRLQLVVEGAPSSGVPPRPSTLPAELQTFVPDNITNQSQAFSAKLNEAIDSMIRTIEKNYTFCFNNIQADKSSTFDISQTSGSLILSNCGRDSGSDYLSRVCGQAEIELYFSHIDSIKSLGLPSTINCNPQSWPRACESGWSGATGLNVSLVDDKVQIPVRSADPKSCCAGFFCPPGLTCMIPCPLGAYCTLASFDSGTGRCFPYGYRSIPGHVPPCGGADLWLTYKESRGIFCGKDDAGFKLGQYCPDPITQVVCEKGHYCRLGSTAPTKCSILSRCRKDGQLSENLITYGGLIIGMLFLILLIIYNCSDLLMHIRERKKSEVRTVAAREAHESVTAVERWRKAKEAANFAKKKAVQFSGELVRSLSRSKSRVSTVVYGNGNPAQSGALPRSHFTTHYMDDHSAGSFSSSELSHTAAAAAGAHPSLRGDKQQELYPLRDGQLPSSQDLYPVDICQSLDLYEAVQVPPVYRDHTHEIPSASLDVDIRLPRTAPLAQTHSQIYKYAYGQIEKEKFEQRSKPASVKDVVDSDGFHDMLHGKGRPKMELSFVDLSLVLKRSGKRILSHVTGKFSPGRVTAVMGPSGAGKTTFLNALAGKETGSRIAGEVFINGYPASIQSYKRIIGFVPQDDIVHGSLTVEENLSFSAKYRLPADTPKQERVLVVERIIQTLSLTAIRDSLVGTVEKRGISGGQRKRVNVGLELVIEPSLLILDEPTSGLDSTASRLVVQSLRREAAFGVNVLVVLHQPSYGLFKMFHDVMLLAKGGYTVYLGPVDELEGYFGTLGFVVPDRVNPPDYFMDVLEGLVVPEADPSFDLTSLPVLWMCHNGYHIPLDLQETAERKQRGEPLRKSYDAQRTFSQEVWHELRVYLLVRWDNLKTDLSSVKDLSGRRTPGFFSQYCLILKRVAKQKFRESRQLAQDYMILLLAGIALGFLADWTDSTLVGKGYMYTLITVALLVMVASLRTFSADKLEFWRESSSGINRLAFFLAKDTADHFQTVVKPVVYLSMFYFFNDPRSTFGSNYIITLALVYCCTGIGYVLAIVMNPQPAQLCAVFIPTIATLLITEVRKGVLHTISQLSYAFWALEAYTIANAERYTGVWLITRCAALLRSSYQLHNFNLCLAVLVGYGIGARLLAFLCLLLFHRKRQK